MRCNPAYDNAVRGVCAALRVALRTALIVSALWLAVPRTARAQVDADMVTMMGRNALSVDDYLTAIRYFNQAIEAKPFLSRPYYYRAYAKFTLEDYTGAEADCTKSIELNPFIVEVYQLRGLCRIHNDSIRGAAQDYTRVLSELPDDQGSRYNRALCYLQLKDYKDADADLDFLLKRWPRFFRTYMVKAQSMMEQKDTLGALRWVDSLLVRNPHEASAWDFKGRYALQHNQYALADSCLSRAIQINGNDFNLYLMRAQARHALNRFGLAIADYDRTIELQPNHFVAHYNRGLLRSFVGDLNRAIEDFDFIIKVEPDNTLAIYNRAQLRQQTGNFRGAIADYSRLIKAYPTFYYGYMARAECRRRIGDIKGALNDETVVARRNLDLAFGKARMTPRKKVRLRSEHELDQYQQLIDAEKEDTVRNVFGTLYGKVQNERAGNDLMPMYALAYRPVYTRGYHAVGFMPEVNKLSQGNTADRQLVLSAEFDQNASAQAADDEKRISQASAKCNALQRALLQAAVSAARYDYTSALNEANQAVQADSSSVVALMQRAFILSRSVASSTLEAKDVHARMSLAHADLRRASHLAANNAYVAYNLGCLFAQQNDLNNAIDQFSLAIALDSRLPEAYYNRAMLLRQQGKISEATADFSRAGQLGLYKAYAQIKQDSSKPSL